VHSMVRSVESTNGFRGTLVKQSVWCVVVALAGAVLLFPNRALADEIEVKGTTSITGLPSTITFMSGSFDGITSGGYAGFSNIAGFSLSTNQAVYNGQSVDLMVAFTLPLGTNGSPSTFDANLYGNVNSSAQGGVTISFPNPSQAFTFSNANGSGSFTFTVNTVSLNPGGNGFLSAQVTNGYMTVPEPGTGLMLGMGLLAAGSVLAVRKSL
jgi:PEP-CTERM motif